MAQCGHSHTVCSDVSGNIWVWGDNSYGQLGLGDKKARNEPVLNEKLGNICEVSCNGKSTICVDTTGVVFGFGYNFHGNLGLDIESTTVPIEITSLNKIRYVACGECHTACIDDYGGLWTFGLNNYGQLGVGRSKAQSQPQPQKVALEKVKHVDCGSYHTLCITESNQAFGFGRNSFGQLMCEGGGTAKKLLPTKVAAFPHPIDTIACGSDHVITLLENGDVYGVGCNDKGQCGIGIRTDTHIPVKIAISDVTKIFCGANHTIVITLQGMYGFGDNKDRQILAKGSLTEISSPERIPYGDHVYSVSRGGFHIIAKGKDGALWAHGRNTNHQLGLPQNSVSNRFPDEFAEQFWEQSIHAKSARK